MRSLAGVAVILLGIDGKPSKAPIVVIPSCFSNITARALDTDVGNSTSTLLHDSQSEHAVIDIAFYDTRDRPDTAAMSRSASSCTNSTRATVRLHAIVGAGASLQQVQQKLPGFQVTLLKLPAQGKCLYSGFKRLSHGPGPQYLYKPLLHFVVPTYVQRLIVLDSDVVMIRDVRELYAQFDKFGSAVLGISSEQSKIFKDIDGKNGGVQLHDISRMRRSIEYNALLDEHASGRAGKRIGFLGDQTLYTYLAGQRPDLFYKLPCEWNRQISMHFGFRDPKACRGELGTLNVLHTAA